MRWEHKRYSVRIRKKRLTFLQNEIELLAIQHQVLSLVFNGKLVFPPIDTTGCILDCGYGAASWAIEVADAYPDCTVSISSSGKKLLSKLLLNSLLPSGHRSRYIPTHETRWYSGELLSPGMFRAFSTIRHKASEWYTFQKRVRIT